MPETETQELLDEDEMRRENNVSKVIVDNGNVKAVYELTETLHKSVGTEITRITSAVVIIYSLEKKKAVVVQYESASKKTTNEIINLLKKEGFKVSKFFEGKEHWVGCPETFENVCFTTTHHGLEGFGGE
jgi:hypothetical protein